MSLLINCCPGRRRCLPFHPVLFCFYLARIAHGFSDGDSGTFIRTPQSQVVGLAGKDAVLRCDFSYPGGKPVPHIIEWSKKGHDVPIFIMYQGYPTHTGEGYEGRLALASNDDDEKASLLIKDIRREDEGWYECKVQLLNRPPETPKNGSWVFLLVHAPPQIVNGPPSEMYVKQGDQVELYCDATGTPSPKISWMKDGEPVSSSPRISQTDNSLSIQSISSSDQGNYECVAKNAEGRVVRAAKLLIASGAVILRPPENQTRLEGERVDLHCKAEGKPNNLTYHWSKDDSPIEQSFYPELSGRVVVQTDGTLIVNPATKADTGKYTCRVTNGIEETPEASAWLSIQFPARIYYNPSLQYLPLGMPGIVRCFIESNPPVQFVQWTKDSQVLDLKSLVGIRSLENGSLRIDKVTSEHQGQYTCTPYNVHGTGGSSIHMNVIVEEPPEFAVVPKQFYQAEQKGTVTMQCAAKERRGKMRPRIHWRRADGAPIPAERSSVKDGKLSIFALRKSDHGRYECLLENDVATLLAETTLLIESTTPHAPTNVTAEPGPFSVLLKWQPAYSGGHPQHYLIWYRTFGSSSRQWRSLRVRPDDATSYTVYNLSPDTLYEFQVLSRNQLGDGLFSDPVIVRTSEIDPYMTVFPTDASGSTYVPTIVKPAGPRPGQPTGVHAVMTTDGLRLTWNRPPNFTIPVMYYMVEHRRTDEPWGKTSDPITSGNTFFLKDTQPGVTYEFKVFAFTLMSFSEPSEILRFTTGSEFVGRIGNTMAVTLGIIGGVVFFVTSIGIVVGIIKCLKRRRKQKRQQQYHPNGHGTHRSQKSERSERSAESTIPLNRGTHGARRGIRCLTDLKLFMKSFSESFSSALAQKPNRPNLRFIGQKLHLRRYSVQVEINREKPDGSMSNASSLVMLHRPAVRSVFGKALFNSLAKPCNSLALPVHPERSRLSALIELHREPSDGSPCYIPFTPTRSDIEQDYLESTVTSARPSAMYDRDKLPETVRRIRGVQTPSTDNSCGHLDNTDSAVALTSQRTTCDEMSSGTFNRSPGSSSVPRTTFSNDMSPDENYEFDIRISPEEFSILEQSTIMARQTRMNRGDQRPLYDDVEIRCQELIREFREFKSRRVKNCGMDGSLRIDVETQKNQIASARKASFDSEC